MPNPDQLSVQLYTVRDALAEDFDGTLAKIAGFGYTQVEPFAFTNFTDELKTGLGKHGLAAPTTHMGLLSVDDQDASLRAPPRSWASAPSSTRPAIEPALADRGGHRRDRAPAAERRRREGRRARPAGRLPQPLVGARVATSTAGTGWRCWPSTWIRRWCSRSTPTGRTSAVPTCPRCWAASATGWSPCTSRTATARRDTKKQVPVGAGVGADLATSWPPRRTRCAWSSSTTARSTCVEAVGASRTYLTSTGVAPEWPAADRSASASSAPE